MKELLALLNSSLVGALAGGAIGYLAARQTNLSERRARLTGLARGLSAESGRIRAMLEAVFDTDSVSQLPRVHEWMVALVTQAGEISADVVRCFLSLEETLGTAELARATARTWRIQRRIVEEQDRNAREWRGNPVAGINVLPPIAPEAGDLAKAKHQAEATALQSAEAKRSVVDLLDTIDALLLPHLKA